MCVRPEGMWLQMGGCQNDGPFLELNTRERTNYTRDPTRKQNIDNLADTAAFMKVCCI